MGAACTTGAAQHIGDVERRPEVDKGRRGSSDITTSLDDLRVSSSHLQVYQHSVSHQYILLPKDLDPTTILEGDQWSKLALDHRHQHEVISRTIAQQDREQKGGTPGRTSGLVVDPQDVGLEMVPNSEREEASAAIAGEAAATSRNRPWSPLTSRGLRCRICEREIPNKALLDEHIMACMLVAEAKEQTRASDDALRTLNIELGKAIEENMKVMLHTGRSKGMHYKSPFLLLPIPALCSRWKEEVARPLFSLSTISI